MGDTKKLTIARLALMPEPLANATIGREACAKCGLYAKCQTPFMRPFVPKGWTGDLLIVGEAPGEHEDKVSHRPFTGEAGKLLAKWLRQAGYSPLDVAFVNACRCRPPKNAAPSMTQVRACRPFVLQTISKLKPQVILGAGNTALRSLTNDGHYDNLAQARGHVLPIPGLDHPGAVYVTYHPAAVLRGATQYTERVLEDLDRAKWPILEWPGESVSLREPIGIDTEFAPDGSLLNAALADTGAASSVSLERGKAIDAKYIAGHSIAGDIDHFVKLGIAKSEWVSGENTYDSLLLARMTDENRDRGAYKLEALLSSSYNVKPWKQPPPDCVEFDETDARTWPADYRAQRCRLDAWAAAVLVKDYLPKARGPIEFTHRVAMTIQRIRHAGVYVDLPAFEKLAVEFGAEAERTRDLLCRTAMTYGLTEFSPTNDGQIRELLFERLKLPVTKKTETGEPAVDKITLKQFADNETVKLLLAFNRADKVYSTNIVGVRLLLIPADDGMARLPVRINPLGARTGRRSSAEPNMQNWPKSVRGMVRSRWPGGKIGDFDYSKLEVILIAWEAGDAKLLDYFTRGGGYIGVGKELWRKTVVADTDEYRITKSIVLGTNYNMSAYKLAHELREKLGVNLHREWDEHLRRAEVLHKRYLDMFPGLRTYMRERMRELLQHGHVVSATGRVRHLPCPRGSETPGFSHLLNQAINFPIQSLASDVTGSALVDVEAALLAEYKIDLVDYHKALLEGRWPEMPILVNEVHDDLVVDFPPTKIERDTELIVETMRAVPTLRKLVPDFNVPLNVGVKVGSAWGASE